MHPTLTLVSLQKLVQWLACSLIRLCRGTLRDTAGKEACIVSAIAIRPDCEGSTHFVSMLTAPRCTICTHSHNFHCFQLLTSPLHVRILPFKTPLNHTPALQHLSPFLSN